MKRSCVIACFLYVVALSHGAGQEPVVIVAEGEQFRPLDKNGWKITHQNDSYASHTYGGMWMTHGGCLAAAAESEGAVAVRTIEVPADGEYRVWSKYQAPPYFNYLHQIEIVQEEKSVFSHVYGKHGTERLWSFSGESDELWWPWGIDHDAAEAPPGSVHLKRGGAEVRVTSVKNPPPAGDRFLDFVLLTTNLADDYQGFKPYKVGTPFALEALAATRLYMRFRHMAAAPARLTVSRGGHFQPNYGGASEAHPAEPVAAGKWSGWFNIGPFCRLVHDEGLTLALPGAERFDVQFARDSEGIDVVGDTSVISGEAVVVPIDITWNQESRVKPSRDHAAEIIAAAKTWRTAGGGKKPRHVLFFGAFRGEGEWIDELKHALGYNTELPKRYPNSQTRGLHGHLYSAKAIEDYAARLSEDDKKNLRFVSFGDEIGLGKIDFSALANQEKFRAWLKEKGITLASLGVEPGRVPFAEDGNARLLWYANRFSDEERFADFRARTEAARRFLGEDVLTGANFSPHHLALYYGPVNKWVDLFKHGGMSMHWAEDYVFSVPEVPQIVSWQFAQMRCGVKYRGQPIHFYVMPHAPGQEPDFLRRNTLLAVGYGARHIDNFWVAPAENFTENYVSWTARDTFRTIHEAIYDTAEAETLLEGGKLRPARVAVVTGQATDFHESRLMVDKKDDPFAALCKNAPERLNQILCRKEQQMLYLALVQAGHRVDVITEDDIAERGELKNYQVVYFAGEWVDDRIIAPLDEWVEAGGILFAAAGLGHLNQFGERETGLLKLLGLKETRLSKNAAIIRTLLELPLMPPIDTITLQGEKIEAMGMRQELLPEDAEVLGTWESGAAAVTVREHGRGKAFAVGTLPGCSYVKTSLRPVPFARGGAKNLYNPTSFDAAATRLVRLGVSAADVPRDIESSEPLVEAIAVDHEQGTLLTLINWTNAPIEDLEVTVKLPRAPASVRSVEGQNSLPSTYTDGAATFRTRLDAADYIQLMK